MKAQPRQRLRDKARFHYSDPEGALALANRAFNRYQAAAGSGWVPYPKDGDDDLHHALMHHEQRLSEEIERPGRVRGWEINYHIDKINDVAKRIENARRADFPTKHEALDQITEKYSLLDNFSQDRMAVALDAAYEAGERAAKTTK